MKRFALLVLLAVSACAPAQKEYTARYECAPNDGGITEMDFFSDGTFKIITGSGYDMKENLVGEKMFQGVYAEGPNTYDLNFKSSSREKLEALFKHTEEGGFIRNADTYRMNKEPGMLYVNGCLMIKRD